jgi:vacuolar-type H+-ATPase subunit E/Vma4
MSIASIGETLENPSVTQIMAAYPTKKIFDDAVKAGKIKPTREVGIVSNIFNRVVQSALSEQAQAQAQTTVLQDNTQPMGLAAAAQMPQQPRGQGLNQVPVPQQMFERQGMANGGIVAFQAGGGARNPRLIGALENVLSQLQVRDPALNVDYVRRAVLSAPESQQRTLMQQLVERVGMDDKFQPAVASFTEALESKEVDPKVLRAMQLSGGLSPDEMATPSPLTKEASGLAAVARDATQSDTGAQYGARPLTGSQILAQKADAAGNIYARPSPPIQLTNSVAGMPGTFAPYEDVISELGQGQDFVKGNAPEKALRAQMEGEDRAAAIRAAQKTPKPVPPAVKPPEAKLITDEGAKKIPGTGLSIEDFQRQQQAFGISADPNRDIREQIDKLEQGTKKEREQAKYMALLQAGLGIMGGTSESALENIGKGAMPAVTQYGAALKDIRSEEKEITKMRSQLVSAEDARKRGDFQAYMGAKDKQADLRLKEDKLKIDREMLGVQKAFNEGRLSEAKARNTLLGLRAKQQQAAGALKAREFFADNEEAALSAEFEKRFGSNWKKSPERMAAFNRQKEARINELAMMEPNEDLVPSADRLLGD